MFRLSKAAKYSIQGILCLAGRPVGEVAGIEAIAREAGVPAAYLAKLFQGLGKHDFIRSVRGPEGGFTLTRAPGAISVLEVIEAVEGPLFTSECLIHEGDCPGDSPCPVRRIWTDAQEGFLKHLSGCSFSDLVRKSGDKRREGTKPPPPEGRRGAAG